MTQLRISEAAALLGVSDDTVRRLVERGELEASAAADGPQTVDGASLARLATERAKTAPESSPVLSSARNHFVGIVTRVQLDGVMAQIDIQAGPHRVVSLISAEAATELGLEVGTLATAVVKATNVSVETTGAAR
ncbi:helix-turn-helix transcriptional regulator [Gryllotalpicola kribbensis]|uniref:Helix-turn-helix transcriptional regulator n=1 Tax=Gryllotalpicola kribbensis TaxID=993084 RepID=A0ABP8AIX2_9MICO